MTNLWSQEKVFVMPPPKPVGETIYLSAYNSCLQLIMSRTRIIDKSIYQTKVETVDSGVLEHLLEQVNELQTDLEVIIRELIPIRREGKPLPAAIGLGKVGRKLKFTMTQIISKHQKLMELMATIKDDETKSDHPCPAKANAISIKLPRLSIPKFDGDFLNRRTFWQQFKVSIHDKEQL